MVDNIFSLAKAAGTVYVTFYTVKFLYKVVYHKFWSSLLVLPGPKSKSFIWGNLQEIFKGGPSEVHLKWIEDYGPTIAYKGFLGRPRLMTLDPKALTYILNHSYDFPKPEEIRTNLAELLGEGLLFAEGDSHKRQRRVMNPSFARPYIRELTEIFHEKSIQLRNILLTEVQNTKSGDTYVTNITSWLSKATLDIIGLAGFDYKFDALNPSGIENELNVAFTNVMKETGNLSILNVLRNFIPILRKIPTEQSRKISESSEIMTRIGLDLVRSKREAILATKGNDQISKSTFSSRDLLSRLLGANMATDLPQNHRLSDHDLYSQIPTILIAGHETTATAATWTLFALSQDMSIQNKLREELLAVETATPSMDELEALPYLDYVVKETMRLHAPVANTIRHSEKDDLIPLATPYKDKNGVLRHEIPIGKGDAIFVPILALNLDKNIWGDDALEFKPERWTSYSEKNHDLPGVYANMLTFLGGPRACIGYRFAIVELKCILFALLRSFQFELAVSADDIEKKTVLVTRPFLKSAPKDGSQMPLKITQWKSG